MPCPAASCAARPPPADRRERRRAVDTPATDREPTEKQRGAGPVGPPLVSVLSNQLQAIAETFQVQLPVLPDSSMMSPCTTQVWFLASYFERSDPSSR